ncbi:hypothetical protein GCM10023149_41830 [Mucilaginibacter gynuensis]|uniref:Uncharacterized protein n=1 Tax=Mucilaginibacter gynuensis TaxID=1302236 RepID=A0ABP8H588_9SPHI
MAIDSTSTNLATAVTFDATYEALKEKFSIEPTGHIDFQLNDFGVFKDYSSVAVTASYRITTDCDSCYIIFADTTRKVAGPRGRITEQREYQTWAIAYLKRDLGRILIRRETLADKIIELIHPIELDFKEDKPFSDTFYVLVDNLQKAIAGIDRNFRNAVMDIREDDFIIEINSHTLLAGSHKPIPPQKALHLAEFIERLISTY